MDYLLDQVGFDSYAVAPAEIAALKHEFPFRQIGAVNFNEGRDQFSGHCIPADVFDVLVYFREATPSRLLEAPA